MRIARLAAAIWLTLLGTMAVAQSVAYDYDRAASFSKYKTYAWTRGSELQDELNHARLVRAIDAALAAKGLTRAEPTVRPDVLVAYHATFDRNLEITGSATGGWGPFGLGTGWGSATIQPVVIGTVIVEISDTNKGAIIWRSFATSDVRAGDKPESRDKKIAKAAEKMFKNYPPKS
jgi:uncharacterized protein DUF4136